MHTQWFEALHQCQTLQDLEALRVQVLGKSGHLTQLLKELGSLSLEEKKEKGAQLNAIRVSFQEALTLKKEELEEKALEKTLAEEYVDVSLPVETTLEGGLHPISKTIHDIELYFSHLGFQTTYGPDIEEESNNFDALNIPSHHPARQSHDTFYMEDKDQEGKTLLRTHTSPVQIRFMRSHKPPFRILAPGRVYRCDLDATHSPMFHQVEGLVVEKGVTMAHLKATIIDFCRDFFGVSDLPVRFRPSYFPFTEPSAEVDIGWNKKTGELGKGNDWLEVLGCGMVHPEVFKNVGLDPNEFQGFAFGLGIERFTMLRHNLSDIRSFYENDRRWLLQTKSPFFSL